ncbi:hypothetical protein D3C80_1766280 [compost metagenome]
MCYSLKRQQLLLQLQPAPVAGQGAVRPDDPVARHNNRNRVLPVSRTDCADRKRAADLHSQLLIGSKASMRNLQQPIPDLLLKGGSPQI